MRLFKSAPPRQIELANLLIAQDELHNRLLKLAHDRRGPASECEEQLLRLLEERFLSARALPGLLCKRWSQVALGEP